MAKTLNTVDPGVCNRSRPMPGEIIPVMTYKFRNLIDGTVFSVDFFIPSFEVKAAFDRAIRDSVSLEILNCSSSLF